MPSKQTAQVVDPTKEKSPEQIAREIEADKLAQKAGREEPKTETLEKADDGEHTILIHFIKEAGFTALARVWYRAQEIEFSIPDGESYKDTFDRKGRSWLVSQKATKNDKGEWVYPSEVTVLDDYQQAERWGEIVYREGPWRGKGWDEDQAALKERERNRAAPVLDKRV